MINYKGCLLKDVRSRGLSIANKEGDLQM